MILVTSLALCWSIQTMLSLSFIDSTLELICIVLLHGLMDAP